MANRPAPEVDVDEAFVRALLAEQFPEFSGAPLALLGRGWDNTNWRLGDEHIVRVPHRAVAAPLIGHEQRWLPMLAERIDLPIPVPVASGEPSAALGYPWAWSIVPWIDGVEAASSPNGDTALAAEDLGRFLHQLHVAAPADAPPNPHRGQPLAELRGNFERRCEQVSDVVDIDAARLVFDDAEGAPRSAARVWLHGDLHTRNMLVRNGRLRAVVDWGDVCAGDRATDLAGAYMLVPGHLDIARTHARATDDDWHRARGWAITFALIYLANSADDPTMRSVGERLLDALSVDFVR